MQIYIFGYGSLMNPESLGKTLPGGRFFLPASLLGYQRKVNVPVDGYLYLNIVPCSKGKVQGKLIAITESELEMLKLREKSYRCMEVTTELDVTVGGTVYTFIAPDQSYPEMKIPRSYIRTCLFGRSEVEQTTWLRETIIENEIIEDLQDPVYANVALEY